MKKYKRFLGWTMIFFFGFLVGAVATSQLERKVRPTFVKMIQSGLKVEQEFLAAKAARENRMFESAVHRWVAVNAESEEGFKIFRKSQTYYNDESILFPLQLLVFEKMNSTENVLKGEKVVEGLDRGKLAASLEIIGENSLAEKEWEKAQVLMNRDLEATRKSVYNFLEYEKTELHLQAEAAGLSDSK
jgi:hypothetical protein